MRINLRQNESLKITLASPPDVITPSVHLEWWQLSNFYSSVVSLSGTEATLLEGNKNSDSVVTGLTLVNTDSETLRLQIVHVIDGQDHVIIGLSLYAGYTLIVNSSGVSVLDSAGQVTNSNALALGNQLRVANLLTTTDGVPGGTQRHVGGVAYRSTAPSSAITGEQETETNFDTSYEMPANSLKPGTVVHIRAVGVHTDTTDTEDHDILLKLGDITLASIEGVDPADDDLFYFDFTFVCRAAGESGAIVGAGTAAAGVPGTASPVAVILDEIEVDTTAALEIAVAIDRQASATDTDSAQLEMLVVEVIG